MSCRLATYAMFGSVISHSTLLFLIHLPLCISARTTSLFTPTPTPNPNPNSSRLITVETNLDYEGQGTDRFLGGRRGSNVSSMPNIKKYLLSFGYFPLLNTSFDDEFVSDFELAISWYQSRLALPITAKLDHNTLTKIKEPRCGVSDVVHGVHSTKHYVYFPGKPRWTRRKPFILTYAFSPDHFIDYISLNDIQHVFKRAFARWASVIPVSFREAEDYGFADIKIGFYSGDHGDGQPFDGVLGILAHSFSPESGRLHLDAAERWAVDFNVEESKVAVDLESVAVHEIGHLLGLAHSLVEDSVMYPSLNPREKRVDLKLDDINGVQALYGSNHKFSFGTSLESETSMNEGVNIGVSRPSWNGFSHAFILLILEFCINSLFFSL